MSELARPVGIGFAARGKVSDVVRWADNAQQRGIHSVWMHDSLYERDAVSYASAIAAQVPNIRVALGALSSYTRTPALIAMTISALDEMAPGRIILGMGTALPLRLAQLGIPYKPDEGVENVSKAIDFIRAMWAGQRIPSATPNLPPIQAMFPPVHRVPVYIAAYRTPFLQLAGEKADGYLARPAESIPNMQRLITKLRKSSVETGRDENVVDVAGYLLTHVDKSRHEALNRAKREPFVIYMMSVLSNFSLEQAGFEPALRDQIMAAWRAEDYHKAAQIIPDDMLDTFMLCGTPEEVAEGAAKFNEAGMNTPIIQPVIQEDDQEELALEAAALYGSVAVREAVTARETATVLRSEGERLNVFERAWRRFGAWTEIARPFSFTASAIPVLSAGALAFIQNKFSFLPFIISLAASVLLHVGTNVTNEIYDVRNGIDSITSPRASRALLKGRLTESEAFGLVRGSFILAILFGIALIAMRGWQVALLGFLGLTLGYGYTAPPFQYKYKAIGLPVVFILMGPLMVIGAYYTTTGGFDWSALIVSIPIGLLVTAILHGNEWRDITDDARYGIGTLSALMGRKWAHIVYVSLVTSAYLVVVIGILAHALPATSSLAFLSLPFFVYLVGNSQLGIQGQQRAIAKIDLETAKLHATFGILYIVGLMMGKV
ncbi:MAG: LLM class flavin-dependent oxidoreductase [Anaerolineales bacterium]|nr:LLM class flavin-dependent oxidoreductase [Anaerolineales bacterium]MDP2778578.1 LLM class flavin-dependent oxidoreductase [Anaerolineales bacterium]